MAGRTWGWPDGSIPGPPTAAVSCFGDAGGSGSAARLGPAASARSSARGLGRSRAARARAVVGPLGETPPCRMAAARGWPRGRILKLLVLQRSLCAALRFDVAAHRAGAAGLRTLQRGRVSCSMPLHMTPMHSAGGDLGVPVAINGGDRWVGWRVRPGPRLPPPLGQRALTALRFLSRSTRRS